MSWYYKENIIIAEDIPEGAIGFIYKIVGNEGTEFEDKIYIGRKNLGTLRKKLLTKKEKLLPENKRKKYKYVAADSNWLTYNTSCVELKQLLEEDESRFTKEILMFCNDAISITYWELAIQVYEEVLFIDSFNGAIGGKFWKGKVKDYRE